MSPSLKQLLAGDPLATSRAISLVENQEPGARELLRRIARCTGRAHRVGVAGPPGAGKSTLIGELIRAFRSQDRSVGILATDPSSTLTGGALLGDRVRIQEPGEDLRVFYRSMATRGYPGGLSRACRDTIRILEASGKDTILVETVGVGQADLDITAIVDTLVLVLVPESGDFIQMLKAGLLEFGDILIVNKSDRPGAGEVADDLREMLGLRPPRDAWEVPVLKTAARDGAGILEAVQGIQAHWEHLQEAGRLSERRQAQALAEMRERLVDRYRQEAERTLAAPAAAAWARRVGAGEADIGAAMTALQRSPRNGKRTKR